MTPIEITLTKGEIAQAKRYATLLRESVSNELQVDHAVDRAYPGWINYKTSTRARIDGFKAENEALRDARKAKAKRDMNRRDIAGPSTRNLKKVARSQYNNNNIEPVAGVNAMLDHAAKMQKGSAKLLTAIHAHHPKLMRAKWGAGLNVVYS